MNLQIFLYFFSILLTCGLTGYLAFHAWRQPVLPGIRTFAALALSECLLALVEIVSLVSRTEAQAIFWFNLRFIFTSVIPIFWLVFALDTFGRRDWVSNRLLASMFIIPLITQVLLWSNRLHGLWVKQDVGFYQTSPFWIAETSLRIPALWFMVHTFYCIGLLLAGIFVILYAAWLRRELYRNQALMLSTGALISLVITLIPIFNILPQVKFNPFIPGIGISALFYALAIFRFQLLKRPPAQEKTGNLDINEKRSLAVFIFTFILFASGFAASGYLAYRNYEKQFRFQVERQLSAIAELKVNELDDMRKGWLEDANVLYRNPAFSELVQRGLRDPEDTQTHSQLQAWLISFRSHSEYLQIRLVDTKGFTHLSAPAGLPPIPSAVAEQIPQVLQTAQITIVDFYRDNTDQDISLSMIIPIMDGQRNDRVIGLVIVRIYPEDYLYPLINEWPATSETAETLLIRRDGGDVLYLNNLKFGNNLGFNLRIPLQNTEVVGVKAVLGQTGVMEGVDYRGESVIADVRSVPASPWVLVSKMDTVEVYKPIRERAWEITLLLGVLVLGAGASLGMLWRQQRLRFYQAQYETSESLRQSEEKYRLLIEQASDGIFMTDASTQYIEVNPSGCAMLGYTRDELLTKRITDLIPPDDLKTTPPRLDELRQGKSLLTQRRLMHKDGSLVPVEISARMFPDGRFQSIIRDITERKRAEDALKESENKYRTLIQNMQVGMVVHSPDTSIILSNPIASHMFGLTQDQLLGRSAMGSSWCFIREDGTRCPLDEYPVNRVLATESPISNLVLGVMRPDRETPIWVRCDAHRVVELDGSLQQVVVTFFDITARKLAEEEYRTILKTTMDSFWIVDNRGRFLDVNDAYCHLIGYSRDEMLQMSIQDVEATEKTQDTEQHIQRVMETGYDRFESQHRCKDGRVIHVEVSSNFQEALGGRFYVFVRDITARKLSEEAIRYQANLLENVNDAITASDAHAVLTVWNHAAETMFGWKAGEVIGRKGQDVFRTEFIGLSREEVFRTVNETGQFRGEMLQARKDGTQFFVEANTYTVRDENGNVSGYVTTSRDITERKYMEEALRDSEERFRSIFEQAAVGIAQVGLDGRWLRVNQRLCNIIGYTDRELLALTFQDITHPDDLYTDLDNVRQVLAGGIQTYSMEKRYIRKDRSHVWINLTVGLVRDATGAPKYFVSVIEDIAERKQAEAELLKTLEELKRSNAELEQFAYVASHDLQEPLRAVAGMVQLLKQRYGGHLDERADEYIRLAVDGATRMQSLISDLLAFSRLNRRGYSIQPTDANESLAFALRNLETTMLEQGATVTSGILPTVDADATQLTQLFQNLIGNGIKFHGSQPPQIQIGVGKLDDAWQFFVRDNGIGIEPQFFERIFLIFQRLHTRRDYPGTGIGLSICKKIVERHGGRIWVESTLGQGTTFYFTIPLKR